MMFTNLDKKITIKVGKLLTGSSPHNSHYCFHHHHLMFIIEKVYHKMLNVGKTAILFCCSSWQWKTAWESEVIYANIYCVLKYRKFIFRPTQEKIFFQRFKCVGRMVCRDDGGTHLAKYFMTSSSKSQTMQTCWISQPSGK